MSPLVISVQVSPTTPMFTFTAVEVLSALMRVMVTVWLAPSKDTADVGTGGPEPGGDDCLGC